jgi:hypothetical protein
MAASDGAELFGDFAAASPLPPAAFFHYAIGGCYSLALALHEATGFPVELFIRDGLPSHAYVVDGDTALHANGRRPLREARALADQIRSVTAAELRRDLAMS